MMGIRTYIHACMLTYIHTTEFFRCQISRCVHLMVKSPVKFWRFKLVSTSHNIVTGQNIPGQNIPRQNILDKIYPDKIYRTKYTQTKYTGQNIPDEIYPDKIYGTIYIRQNIPDKIHQTNNLII